MLKTDTISNYCWGTKNRNIFNFLNLWDNQGWQSRGLIMLALVYLFYFIPLQVIADFDDCTTPLYDQIILSKRCKHFYNCSFTWVLFIYYHFILVIIIKLRLIFSLERLRQNKSFDLPPPNRTRRPELHWTGQYKICIVKCVQ